MATVPVAVMARILGVDRFMSEWRAITNFIGNAVTNLVDTGWEGAFDRDAKAKALSVQSSQHSWADQTTPL